MGQLEELRSEIARKLANPATNQAARRIYKAMAKKVSPLPGNGMIIIKVGGRS